MGLLEAGRSRSSRFARSSSHLLGGGGSRFLSGGACLGGGLGGGLGSSSVVYLGIPTVCAKTESVVWNVQ